RGGGCQRLVAVQRAEALNQVVQLAGGGGLRGQPQLAADFLRQRRGKGNGFRQGEPALQRHPGGLGLTRQQGGTTLRQRGPALAQCRRGLHQPVGGRGEESQHQAEEGQGVRSAAAPFPPALGEAAVAHATQRQVRQVATQVGGEGGGARVTSTRVGGQAAAN